jgi:hypothetical protein
MEAHMSIAALSNTFVSQVRRAASAPPPVEATEPVRAAPRTSAGPQGRRHELVAAMNQALGVDAAAPQDKRTEQAVFRFAHTLMHDLRTLAGEDRDGARAWGRRDWGDLSQRLQALARAADGPSVPAPAPEVPDQPDPLTAATAAVHIMKVPSSHLLAAFVAMQRALGHEAEVQGSADEAADALDGALAADDAAARAALAELARRLASSIAPATASALPAGSVLDLSA